MLVEEDEEPEVRTTSDDSNTFDIIVAEKGTSEDSDGAQRLVRRQDQLSHSIVDWSLEGQFVCV